MQVMLNETERQLMDAILKIEEIIKKQNTQIHINSHKFTENAQFAQNAPNTRIHQSRFH